MASVDPTASPAPPINSPAFPYLQLTQFIFPFSRRFASSPQVVDNGGLYFVPAFSGLFAPYWRPDARGLIIGLSAFHTSSHLVRAAIEAAAFQTEEVNWSERGGWLGLCEARIVP